jgi:hypothetical protein
MPSFFKFTVYTLLSYNVYTLCSYMLLSIPFLFYIQYSSGFFLVNFISLYTNYPQLIDKFFILLTLTFITTTTPRYFVRWISPLLLVFFFSTTYSINGSYNIISINDLYIYINYLLHNVLNYIHPPLLQMLTCYIYTLTFINMLVSVSYLPDYKYNYFLKLNLNATFLYSLIFLTLFLGCFWAQQLSIWGGWWNWDSSEFLLIIILALIVVINHLRYSISFLCTWHNLLYFYTSIYLVTLYWNKYVLIWNFHLFFTDFNLLSINFYIIYITALILLASVLIFLYYNISYHFKNLIYNTTLNLNLLTIYFIFQVNFIVIYIYFNLYTESYFYYWKFIFFQVILCTYMTFYVLYTFNSTTNTLVWEITLLHLILIFFQASLVISEFFFTVSELPIMLFTINYAVSLWNYNNINFNYLVMSIIKYPYNFFSNACLNYDYTRWIELSPAYFLNNLFLIFTDNEIFLFLMLLCVVNCVFIVIILD